MIKKHNLISSINFKYEIETELLNFNIEGFISINILEMFYDLFAWVYIEDNIENAFYNTLEAKKLEQFINRFNLKAFKGDNLAYSAILLYVQISKLINLRSLDKKKVVKVENNSENKLFIQNDFTFLNLFKYYKDNKYDIPKKFLLFNDVFNKNYSKKIDKIKNLSQLYNITSISDLVKPDLKYKLATKALNVNSLEIFNTSNNNRIIVLQDSTFSMQEYDEKLLLLKAFILDRAITNNYTVEWILGNTEIIQKDIYTKDNIKDIIISNIYSGINFNIINIIKYFKEKEKLIIITDGEDTFDIPFAFKIKEINLISFNDNINLKTNIMKYGRFFKL